MDVRPTDRSRFDMLTLPLRQAQGAMANGAEKKAGPRLGKTAALAAGDVFWPALIAALFICWAMSASTHQSLGLTGESPGCRLVGKAGVVCSASGPQKVISEGNSCISLGKAGRYCSAPTK
jgi:hypothetical protein